MPFTKGGVPSKPMPLFDLFVRHVQATDTCWLWTGSTTRGYGYFEFRDRDTGKTRRVRAVRWLYEQQVGPIPPGRVLDHFECDNPACVRPDHVRPVTSRENILRGGGLAATNLAKTHCPRNHEYTEENTLANKRGARVCRTCNRERQRLIR